MQLSYWEKQLILCTKGHLDGIEKSERGIGKKVQYVGGMDHYDGLTTNKTYLVIQEGDSQFIVRNDLGGVSGVQKSKFRSI